jgi:hypothetical protein
MGYRIRNNETGKLSKKVYESEGLAWEDLKAVGEDPTNPDVAAKYHIYDEGKAESLRAEGKQLGEKSQQLAESPMLQEEDMTAGETAASYMLPVSYEFARRGKDPSAPALAEGAVTALAGPAYQGTKFLASKVLPKAAGLIAPLVTAGAYGLGSEYGEAKAQDREMTPGGVALQTGLGLAPDAAVGALRKGPKVGKYFAKQTGESLTGVPAESLERFGGGIGPRAKQIKKAEGTGEEIASEMLELSSNPPFEEEALVREALKGTQVNTDRVVGSLRRGIANLGEQKEERAAKKILMARLADIEAEIAKGPITGDRLRFIRGLYDDVVYGASSSSSQNKAAKLANKHLKKARNEAMQELQDVAGTGQSQVAQREAIAENKAISQQNIEAQRNYEQGIADAEAERVRKQAAVDEEAASKYQYHEKEADRLARQAEGMGRGEVRQGRQGVAGRYSPEVKKPDYAANVYEASKMREAFPAGVSDDVVETAKKDFKAGYLAENVPDAPKIPADVSQVTTGTIVKPVPIPEIAPSDPKYVSVMASYAKKMQAFEKLNKMLGQTPLSREMRIDSFINTFTNKNKTAQRKMMKLVDDAFGQDFSKRIQDYIDASKLGLEGGKAALMTQRPGSVAQYAQVASAWNPIGWMSSPKVASGAIGVLGKAEDLASKYMYKPAVDRLKAQARPFGRGLGIMSEDYLAKEDQ